MLSELIPFIVNEVPHATRDLKESLDLLSGSIQGCLAQLGEQLIDAHQRADYKRSIEISQQSEKIKKIENQIQQIVSQLDEDLDNYDNSDVELEKMERKIPNYREYYIDQKVEYSLNDDFTHKRPVAFKLNHKKELAKDWKEVLIKTLAILAQKDINILKNFTVQSEMQGKRVPYFSEDQHQKMRKPIKIEGTDIYVETNLSANSIRDLVIKVLNQYEIPMNQYKIYLKADYSELHR